MRKLWTPRRELILPRRQRGMLNLAPSVGLWGKIGFRVDAADFDGTNDFMTRGAGLSGAADSKSGILSAWLRVDGGDGTVRGIFNIVTTLGGGVGRCNLVHIGPSGNILQLQAQNAAGITILTIRSTSGIAAGAAWRHILCSWDLAAPATHMYLDDANDENTAATLEVNDTIDYTVADSGVCALPDSTAKWNGAVAELYFAPGQFLDFSTISNRRKFRNEVGKPVYLGADGSIPTGTAPLVYFHLGRGEAVANFATNRGTGGNFTITGSLDLASTSPSD